MRAWLACTLLVLGLMSSGGLLGCGGSEKAEDAELDRENARASWRIDLDENGSTHEIPVERFDIYLTEDADHPEIFEFHGDGVTLVGKFPSNVRVDYSEDLENLIGQPIQIEAQGGDPGEPKLSKITLDGVVAPVATGTFTVERLSGKIQGSDGDRTVHGRIELHLRRGDGEHILRGTFGAHAVTWG
jgi:hypothetical protein